MFYIRHPPVTLHAQSKIYCFNDPNNRTLKRNACHCSSLWEVLFTSEISQSDEAFGKCSLFPWKTAQREVKYSRNGRKLKHFLCRIETRLPLVSIRTDYLHILDRFYVVEGVEQMKDRYHSIAIDFPGGKRNRRTRITAQFKILKYNAITKQSDKHVNMKVQLSQINMLR